MQRPHFRESTNPKYPVQLGAPPIPPPPILRKDRSRERPPPPPPVRSSTALMANSEVCMNSFEPVVDGNRSSGAIPNIQVP